MTARVFIRAAKLDFTEDDVYGRPAPTSRPGSVTYADDRGAGLPKDVLWESCAIMQYLGKHRSREFVRRARGKARARGQRDVDIVRTLYPYIVR